MCVCIERERERSNVTPEGLWKDEEAGEANGVGGVRKEESGAVAKIGVGGVRVRVEKARELGGGDWVVEDVFADEDIGWVESERNWVGVERRPA